MVVIEQPDEVDRIIEASRSLGAAPYIGVRAKLSSRSTGRWGSSVGTRPNSVCHPRPAGHGGTPEATRPASGSAPAPLPHRQPNQRHRCSQGRLAGSRPDLCRAVKARRANGLSRRWWGSASTTTAAAPPLRPPRLLPAELRQRRGGHRAGVLRTE